MDLKERIKKKNARIRELNKKIKELEDELQYEHKMRWNYWSLYNSIINLVPIKLYKITYEYYEYGELKRESKSIKAHHFEEAKIKISNKLNIEKDEINFIEIQQMAS